MWNEVCNDRSMGDLATDTTVDQTGPSSFSCDLSPDWERLINEASAPVASDGLVAGVGRVWIRDRQLVALGGSTLLCRPAARGADR